MVEANIIGRCSVGEADIVWMCTNVLELTGHLWSGESVWMVGVVLKRMVWGRQCPGVRYAGVSRMRGFWSRGVLLWYWVIRSGRSG